MSFDIEKLSKTHPHLRVVNCAECGKLLSADGNLGPLPSISGRILNRPYCYACLRCRPKPPPGRGTMEDDGGPWQQNAVRILEGD